MSDYNFLMESRLSAQQFQVLNALGRIAGEQGLNLYLVGGAVRDLTHGQQVVHDLDFSVEGNRQKLLRRLEAEAGVPRRARAAEAPAAAAVRIERQQSNARLNAVELEFSGGVRAELAECRQEVYAKPGARPELSPATIFEDLRRRDFSANAMAISLHPYSRGLLLDPTNGAADIEKRELRVLHSRSFLEDPARIYRGVRLVLRLDFKFEERTKNLLESAIESRQWMRLDPAQQGRELSAILREQNPARILRALAGRGLLPGLDKKLARVRIPYDAFGRISAAARSLPGADPFLLNFNCLADQFGGGQRGSLAKKIIGDAKVIKLALGLESAAKKLARTLGSSKAALPSRVWNLLSGQPQPLLLCALVHFPQRKVQNRIRNFLFKYPQVRARMPRAELQAMGAEPGAKFEKILEQLFFDQLDGKIKTYPQLVKTFRARAGIKEPPPKPAKPAKLTKPAKPAQPAQPAIPAQPPTPAKPSKPGKPPKPDQRPKPAPDRPAKRK